jgi:hypothetical protein
MENNKMERIRELLGIMNDIPKGICISPTDDVKKDYITTIPSIFLNARAIPIRKSLITDSYLSELGLDKQTYSERELNENLQLISKHPECIVEKYDTMNWTESTFYTIIDIADYISADHNEDDYGDYCSICFIYNNIIVFIESDSVISKPSIQYKYVKSQIDICDLDKIKKAFKFLSAF